MNIDNNIQSQWYKGNTPHFQKPSDITIGHGRNIHRCKHCGNLPASIKVAPLKYCIDSTGFEPEMGLCKDSNSNKFERLLKRHIRRFNNVAGSRFTFPDGTNKEIYRSAYLSESPLAIKELAQDRGVKVIINIHNNSKISTKEWIKKEEGIFRKYGGKKYIHIPDFNYKYLNIKEKEAVFEKIRKIVQLVLNSEGNVLVHCGGGEHRSGVIYAILHRCFHDISLETIIQEYKCHCAWENDHMIGGYHHQNVELIKDFPIESITGTPKSR